MKEFVEKRQKIKKYGTPLPKVGKVVNEFDFLTALSNRRLSSQSLGKPVKLSWSIDRITIVGETRMFEKKHDFDDIKLYDFKDVFEVLSTRGIAEPVARGWVLKDEYGENIAYAEELQYQVGKARIDFNPNKLGRYLEDDLKTFFKKLFINPHFSRADIACDIVDIPDDYITQYTVCSDVKTIMYHDRAGRLQTAYWGSRSSERQVRLYNKYVEQTRKKEVIPSEIETWWRLEMQLRRDKASNWINIVMDTLSEFCSPLFFPSDWKVTDKVMLTGLMSDISLWGQVSKNTRSKYKKMQRELVKEDALTYALVDTFKENFERLKDELDTWLVGLDVTEKE